MSGSCENCGATECLCRAVETERRLDLLRETITGSGAPAPVAAEADPPQPLVEALRELVDFMESQGYRYERVLCDARAALRRARLDALPRWKTVMDARVRP